jgi:hypothetical protein
MVRELVCIFNNREIATIIWSIICLGLVFSRKPVRKSLRGFVEAFSDWKIITYFFLMLLYVTGTVAVLYLLGFWKLSLLKDTIVWFCFSGVALGVTSVTSGKDKNVFKDAVADNVKAVVLIEFIANSYTFSLVGELLFVPVVSLVVLLAAVAETKEEYSSVASVFRTLQMILGAGILILSVRDIVVNYREHLTLDTLSDLLLPPILSILFLPFIYLGLVFTRYESLFLNLKIGGDTSPSMRRYAKRKIFSCCGLRLKRIQQMLEDMGSDLRHIETKEDVDRIVGSFEGG